MPSTTPRMARTMAGVAHDPAFAKKMGIPQSVGKEFNQADKGTAMLSKAMSNRTASYASGGPVMAHQNSRFMKTPDTFRTDKERQDYPTGKKSFGDNKGAKQKDPFGKDESKHADTNPNDGRYGKRKR